MFYKLNRVYPQCHLKEECTERDQIFIVPLNIMRYGGTSTAVHGRGSRMRNIP